MGRHGMTKNRFYYLRTHLRWYMFAPALLPLYFVSYTFYLMPCTAYTLY